VLRVKVDITVVIGQYSQFENLQFVLRVKVDTAVVIGEYSQFENLQFVLRVKVDTTVVIGKSEEKCHVEDLGIEGADIIKIYLRELI
jgi:hypothetical protein